MTFRLAQVQRSEHEEQAAIFRWAEIMAKRAPELDLLFCIPNGGHRDIRVAARLKKEGVRAGVPDMCLPVPRNGFAALYVELKRSRGGSLSKAQRAWHERLRDAGNRVEVCHGANRAIEIISGYLGLA